MANSDTSCEYGGLIYIKRDVFAHHINNILCMLLHLATGLTELGVLIKKTKCVNKWPVISHFTNFWQMYVHNQYSTTLNALTNSFVCCE